MPRFLSRILLPVDVVGWKDGLVRGSELFVGLCLFGFAISFYIRGAVGVGPWDVFALGVVRQTGLSFGLVTVMISFGVLLLWIPLKQRLGIATLANAVLVGIAADIGLHLIPEVDHLAVRIAFVAIGMVMLAFASGVYLGADFGAGPRDGLMNGLRRVTGWPIWVVRSLIEGGALAIGWVLGGPVGIGTVIFAFGIGPLIGVFLPAFERRAARRRIARNERRAERTQGASDAVEASAA